MMPFWILCLLTKWSKPSYGFSLCKNSSKKTEFLLFSIFAHPDYEDE